MPSQLIELLSYITECQESNEKLLCYAIFYLLR